MKAEVAPSPYPDTPATLDGAAGLAVLVPLVPAIPPAPAPAEAATPPVDAAAPAAAVLPDASGVPAADEATPAPAPAEAEAPSRPNETFPVPVGAPATKVKAASVADQPVAPKPPAMPVTSHDEPMQAAAEGPLLARPAETEVLRAEVPAVQAPVAVAAHGRGAAGDGAASGVAPGVAATAELGVALRDAAPPAWHLAADPGQTPARVEVPSVPHQVQSVPPQAVIAQVAVAIGKASDDRMEIRLDPPELGRVQIHLTRLDGGVHAVVLADRPETQDLLRRHAEALARELGEAGYDTVSLDFTAGHEARAGRDDGRGADWAQSAVVPDAETAEGTPSRRSMAGGLDVRL